MAHEATSGAGRRRAALRGSEALRARMARLLAASRVAVLLLAFFAALSFGPAGRRPRRAERPEVRRAGAHPLRSAASATRCSRRSPAGTPSGTCAIADSGYGGQRRARRVLPALSAASCAALGELGGGSSGALLIAAYVMSLAAFLGALVLLYRLVALELGRPARRRPRCCCSRSSPARSTSARPTRRACSCSLSVGAFYAARTGRWALGRRLLAAAAAATRSAGIVLLLPLALLLWSARPRRAPPAAPTRAWLLLAPLGLGGLRGLPRARAGRRAALPPRAGRLVAGLRRTVRGRLGRPRGGVDGARQLLSGQRAPRLLRAGGRATRSGWPRMNIMLFGFLVFAAVAVRRRPGGGCRAPTPPTSWRRCALPLCFPVEPAAADVAATLPRGAVPDLHVARARVRGAPLTDAHGRRCSAIGLGLFTAQYATWHFIA